MIEVREERPEDVDAVRGVNSEAFGQPDEAALVDKLRAQCDQGVSLVAVDGDDVVGHILFTPASIGDKHGMGLAPMAVAPERQRDGIGSKLVRAGLVELAERGCPFVIVLGHPLYYPRFGFERASTHDIRCEWDVPDEAFMILVIDQRAMSGVAGLARYRPEFSEMK